jgi:energy-coupling factor transporter ATP-binding protein EcfA2
MTTENIAPGIFESFNARFLKPEEVAKTFVISDHFIKLSNRNHSLVVGPRGSGKTTIMKMLQGPALSSWKHPDAKKYRERIDYTGVFIPTDIVWAKQIQSLGEKYLTPEQHELFANAVFTTHTLHELIQAISHRLITPNSNNSSVHRGVICTTAQEVNFVTAVSKSWHLNPDILSLVSLKQSLTKRIGDIYEIVSKEGFLSPTGRDERLANTSYLHINFLQSIVSAIEIFGHIFGDIYQIWTLMFDELELAPNYLVKHLINSLRSSDQRIIFKLSFSPFNENIDLLQNALAAMPMNDFEYIQLWYPNKEDGAKFSKALVASMLNEKRLGHVDLNQIFGYSRVEENRVFNKYKRTDREESPQVKLFKRMYNNDGSFKEYIKNNRIDLDNLDNLNENERARYVRKIYSIALVRDAFRSPDVFRTKGRQARRRSRKAYPDIYAGAKGILEILEGNPRWIIGVIGPLLDQYGVTQKTIDTNNQLDEVKKASNQFRSLLSALPCDVSPKGEPPKSIISILDMIGEFFHKEVVLGKFQPEPFGSFSVDKRTTKVFEKSLALALNAGAIVYIPGNSSQLIIKSLIDRKFRLSYLLAPHYKIPIQLMRDIPLSHILQGNKVNQLSLFIDLKEDK